MDSLRLPTCQTFEMRPPPTLDEQITNVLSDLDAELCAQETRLEKTRKIKQTMRQGLFIEKTRLL